MILILFDNVQNKVTLVKSIIRALLFFPPLWSASYSGLQGKNITSSLYDPDFVRLCAELRLRDEH